MFVGKMRGQCSFGAMFVMYIEMGYKVWTLNVEKIMMFFFVGKGGPLRNGMTY